MNTNLVPLDDDFMDRYAAHADADDRPTIWTPEHVQARMIEAFDVLLRSGVTVGPSRKSGFWPPVVHEFSDLIDQQAREDAEARGRIVRSRPTSDEASRMEESLAWPMRYLTDPLHGDALTLFALCKATDRNIAPILHHRKIAAMKIADRMMREANATPEQRAMIESRAAITAEVLAWANARLAGVTTADGKAVIRTKARRLWAKKCKEQGCEPVRIAPHEAVPGVCLSRTTLDEMRKRATKTIAKALISGRVVIR